MKIAWDTRFKKNRKLILALCGSVSSWIDRNILNSGDFTGRVSLSLDLRELPLDKCNEFFREVGGAPGRRMSMLEKARILSVTGGVPRYLEEIDYRATAGFVQRDYAYSLATGKRGKLSRYRLKDNYLRFHLKYIEPAREKIEANLFEAHAVRSASPYFQNETGRQQACQIDLLIDTQYAIYAYRRCGGFREGWSAGSRPSETELAQ